MKLMFHVLKNNQRLNIDNETINFRNISFKLLEEFNEVMKAISNYNKSKSLQDINFEHKDKLINRGWIIKTGIEVDVKE